MRIEVVAMAVVFCLIGSAHAQNVQGIPLNPGERLISVNGQPIASNPQPQASGVRVASRPAAQAASSNIVGQLQQTGLPFSHSPGGTALDKANHERQRKGQRAVMLDPQLQQLALQKATIAAQRSYKNHIGGSLGGAACEGVGHTQGRFLTCCLDKAATYGGAAMVQGRDGWYCCLLVR